MPNSNKKEPRPKLAETPAKGAAAHFSGRPINRKNLERAKARALANRPRPKQHINSEA